MRLVQNSMNATKPKVTWKTVLLPIIGLVAFFLYIYFYQVDIQGIIATAQSANPLFFSAAVLISLAEVFFYSISWRTLLNSLQVELSIVKSNLFVWYGIFIDIIVPAESVSGEACRVYLVTREKAGTSGKVVASLVVQRLLGMGINVVALILGVILLLSEGQTSAVIFSIILFFTIAIVTILCLFIILSYKENLSLKIINGLMRVGDFITRGKWKLYNRIKEETYKMTRMFHSSMQEYRRKPQAVFASLFWLAVNWTCSLSIPYLVFLSLGFPVSLSVILISAALVVAVKSVPIGVPFEVGLPEIATITFYYWLGVPAGIGATVTILSRLITLWLRFGIGFVVQQWLELRLIVTSPNSAAADKA
jgi:uncharacterized protein (TIRG00374 family)